MGQTFVESTFVDLPRFAMSLLIKKGDIAINTFVHQQKLKCSHFHSMFVKQNLIK